MQDFLCIQNSSNVIQIRVYSDHGGGLFGSRFGFFFGVPRLLFVSTAVLFAIPEHKRPNPEGKLKDKHKHKQTSPQLITNRLHNARISIGKHRRERIHTRQRHLHPLPPRRILIATSDSLMLEASRLLAKLPLGSRHRRRARTLRRRPLCGLLRLRSAASDIRSVHRALGSVPLRTD